MGTDQAEDSRIYEETRDAAIVQAWIEGNPRGVVRAFGEPLDAFVFRACPPGGTIKVADSKGNVFGSYYRDKA